MPTGSRSDHTPRWRQIEAELEQRIEAGQYRQSFPGELALADEFQVSRGTMRNALRRLRESGQVVAERGRRPRITSDRTSSSYGAIYSLHEIVTESGGAQQSTVLDQSVVVDPAIAAALATDDVEFFHLHRVRWADSAAIAVDEIWVPASIAEPLSAVDFSDTAFYKELRDRCGVVIAGGEEEITAATATPELAELLHCPQREPLLHIERVAHDGIRSVEFRRTCVLSSRFSVTRPFGATGPTER